MELCTEDITINKRSSSQRVCVCVTKNSRAFSVSHLLHSQWDLCLTTKSYLNGWRWLICLQVIAVGDFHTHQYQNTQHTADVEYLDDGDTSIQQKENERLYLTLRVLMILDWCRLPDKLNLSFGVDNRSHCIPPPFFSHFLSVILYTFAHGYVLTGPGLWDTRKQKRPTVRSLLNIPWRNALHSHTFKSCQECTIAKSHTWQAWSLDRESRRHTSLSPHEIFIVLKRKQKQDSIYYTGML